MPFQKFKALAQRERQTTLVLDFLIVGGGIAGLACAVALLRVGHRVTVLERDNSLQCSSGPCRMPPNLSKILYHWGLEDEVNAIAIKSGSISILLYETDQLLGKHLWDKEILKEARGEFVFTSHLALRKLLYDIAVSCGGAIHLGVNVAAIDAHAKIVTSDSGARLRADVIIGADGPQGVTIREFPSLNEQPNGAGMVMYSAIVPRNSIADEPDLAYLYDQSHVTMFTWFGSGHSMFGYPIGDGSEFGLCIYAPNKGHNGYWKSSVTPRELGDALTIAGSNVQKLIQLAPRLTVSDMLQYPDLEYWVHDSGNMVLLGEAAHTLPLGSVQATAMVVEDGAVLAKLFSHLRSKDQISSFLWAFQDLRWGRCRAVEAKEAGHLQYTTMPAGEEQRQRNAAMIAKHKAGMGVLQGYDGEDEPAEWLEVKEMFSYDAEDEADNWWVQWGLLRERAKGVDFSCETPIEIAVSH